MKKIQRLIAAAAAKAQFTHDELLGLNTLIHDKDHVLEHGRKFGPLEKALKLLGRRTQSRVYRGLSRAEWQVVQTDSGHFTFKGYTSFSEDAETARAFAEDYGTSTVLVLERGVFGFCLWRWATQNLKDLKESDPKEYAEYDGDFLIESYAEEKEWIFPMGISFQRFVDPVKRGKTTYIDVRT